MRHKQNNKNKKINKTDGQKITKDKSKTAAWEIRDTRISGETI